MADIREPNTAAGDTAAPIEHGVARAPSTPGMGAFIGIGAGLGMVLGIILGEMVMGMVSGAALGTVAGAISESLRSRRAD